MMKRNLLITALFALAISAMSYSQCFIDPQYQNSGLWPDPATGIASGKIDSAYVQNFTIVVPVDTTIQTVTSTINSATITGVAGLPTGLSYNCTPASCIYPGDSKGCMEITGTPTDTGIFTVTVTVVINIEVPIFGPTDVPQDFVYTLTIADTAGGCAAPSAGFTPSATDLTVVFSDASTVSGPATYAWTFGDGNTSTIQNPSNTYALGGTYNVCLTVIDSCGTNTSCSSITVSISGCPLPSASFTPSANDLAVTFADASTVTGPVTYAWIFGDGNVSTTQNPSNTYATAGSYNVCLTVIDSCGTDSSCYSVTVSVTGIAETNGVDIMDFTILPNPSSAMTKIRFNSTKIRSIRFQLYNLLGEKLMDKGLEVSMGINDVDLNASELKAGIYFVSLSSGSNTITKKLVVRGK